MVVSMNNDEEIALCAFFGKRCTFYMILAQSNIILVEL